MKRHALSIAVYSFAVFFCLIAGGRLTAAEQSAPLRFFVSLEGDDTWSGTSERPSSQENDGPFRTLEAARDAVRRLPLDERHTQPIEICILPGTHVCKAPLMLEVQDSGTKQAPIVYRSWTDDPTVISGGKEVHVWNQTELNGRPVLVADLSKLPEGCTPFEQLWVNGHRAMQARTPNRGYLSIPTAPEVDPSLTGRGGAYHFPYAPADAHHFDGVEDGVAVVFNKWLEYHMPLDRMDGAVRLQDARHCLFESCEITAVGNYGLELATGCSDNRVMSCDIHDLGGGGILIGAKIRPRGPKSGYQPGEDIPPVLEHPSDATSHNEIADCRIHDGGRYFHCAVGVWIGQSPDNNVHHNEIYNLYYSGISSGWTWGYGPALAIGNRFEFNHIHHIGQLTNGDGRVLSDMGGIYTLGNQTGTVIRNNVFHDVYAGTYGGWAIYFDEGTRNILAENNLVYRCRHSCFNQHYGRDNIVRNNIFAFGDTSVVCLARAESHTSFVLTNNILLSDGTPMYAGGYQHKVDRGGAFKADYNLVWWTAGKVLGAQDRFPSRTYEPDEPVLSWQQWQALGYDQNTIIADPGFKDPAEGDFRLSKDSPVSQIGFKPFALDKAGPR